MTIISVTSWLRAHSLWYFSAQSGCCSDDFFQTFSCKYDLERFGCVEQDDPAKADILVIGGSINVKLLPYLVEIYQRMLDPKYVIALGACGLSGGIFTNPACSTVITQLERWIPIDVKVPGCPPRPESIMHGIITLQEKICGSK